ncbi:MAG: hypothetical protein HZC41_09675 [Chloroflexi bacterium]|nr:hypothetical protein [Chloroflexota bacterium]
MFKRVSLFPVGLLLIVVLAGLLRLPYTGWGLPYVEYPDETHLYYHGQAYRGLYDASYTGIYPPAFIWLNVAIQQTLEAQGQPGLAPTVQALRVLAAVANTITAALIGMAAYRLAGTAAGWMAAAGWALAPVAVEHALYAIPEPFLYPLVGLCLLLAIEGWLRSDGWRWSLASLLVAALTILLEYRMFVLLVPGGLTFGWYAARGRNIPLRRWLLLLTAVLAAGTLVVTGVFFALPRYQTWLVRILLFDLWNLTSLSDHLGDALRFIGPPILVIAVLAGGGVGWWISRQRGLPHPPPAPLAILIGMFLLVCWVMSAIRWSGDLVRSKNVLIASEVGLILFGIAFAQIIRLAPRRWLRPALALLLAAVLLVPQAQAAAEMLQGSFTGVSWHVIIRQWADVNVPPDTVIVYPVHGSTFNPFWGGIPHRYWFDWWPTTDIMEHSLEEWRAQGMAYALIPIPQHRAMERSAAGQAYLHQMLRLRDFVHPPVRRAAEAVFYRLWRMEVETDVRFGDAIRLVGYDRSAEAVAPDDSLTLRFYWNVSQTPADNYSLFVHLVPMNEYTVLAQADGAPAVTERPTLTWNEPSETLISPPFTVTVPADLSPGEYRVMVGLYNFQSGARLPVFDASGAPLGDALPLMILSVNPT